MANCGTNEYGYALVLVLFILLVIIGAAWIAQVSFECNFISRKFGFFFYLNISYDIIFTLINMRCKNEG